MEEFYIREIFHYFLHLIFPGFLAYFFWRKTWRYAYLILVATMLVDLDHIFADPLFDPNRNSIGYHPLHTYPMIALYCLGTIFLKGKWKIVATGLLFHMFTDFQDFYFWRWLQLH